MSYNQYQPQTRAAAPAVDAGLQAFMRGVYNTMAAGLVVTGIAAFAVANIPALFNALFGTGLVYIVMLAPLAFVWMGFTPARIARKSAAELRTTFVLFSALMGVSMAAILHVFTGASIARAFFITAGTFAGMSLWGYTTKRDLTGLGSFMMMGLIGIFIAALVNMFLQSAMVHFVVSVLGVFIFTGLAAWDTQRLKETYAHGAGEANDKLAVTGALSLYLNFINLFHAILHLMGDRR